MKVAVSNIAWPAEQDTVVAEALAGVGVTGIEVAPTKIWPAPLEASDAHVDAYRGFWEARGISIVAAQALLFGRTDLTLFEDAATRQRTLDYLSGIARLCGRLGAMALVFGSPKNRRAGGRERTTVWQEAIDFFGRLGEVAAAEGTAVAIEANPPEYGADFLTTAAEALELVRAVDHPGCRFHLDSACMTLAGDDPAKVIPQASDLLVHFHASEPYLAPVGQGGIDHGCYAESLAAAGYGGWVSIEMRQVDPFNLLGLLRVVNHVKRCYGS